MLENTKKRFFIRTWMSSAATVHINCNERNVCMEILLCGICYGYHYSEVHFRSRSFSKVGFIICFAPFCIQHYDCRLQNSFTTHVMYRHRAALAPRQTTIIALHISFVGGAWSRQIGFFIWCDMNRSQLAVYQMPCNKHLIPWYHSLASSHILSIYTAFSIYKTISSYYLSSHCQSNVAFGLIYGIMDMMTDFEFHMHVCMWWHRPGWQMFHSIAYLHTFSAVRILRTWG